MACGLVPACASVLVLFAWLAGVPGLVQLRSTHAPVMANEALAILLAGLALVLSSRSWSRWTGLAGAGCLVLSALTLAEYGFNLDLGIDQLLFDQPIQTAVSHPGRMAPNTAVCLALLGVALVAGRPPFVVGLLASLSVALAGVACIGYLFEISAAYGWGGLTRMPLPSAIAVLMLGAGLMILAWRRESGSTWLPFLALAGVTLAALCLWQALVMREKDQIQWATQNAGADVKRQVAGRVRSCFLSLMRLADADANRESWTLAAEMILLQNRGVRAVVRHPSNWCVPAGATVLPVAPERQSVRDVSLVHHHGRLVASVPILDGETFHGFVFAVLDAGALLEDALENTAVSFSITIRDGDAALFARNPSPRRESELLAIDLPGARWMLDIRPGLAVVHQAQTLLPEAVLILGVLLALLLAMSLYLLQHSAARAREAELANRELKVEMARREKAQAQLKEREESYRDLFENAHDLIQSVSLDGRFLYVNPQWGQTLGYSPEEVSRLTMFDILHPDSRPRWRELLQRAMTGERVDKVEAEFVTKSGERVAVEGSCSCKFESDKPVSVRIIFRDITRRKQVEQMKDEFICIVSHELRTPLTSIHGSLGLLANEAAGTIPQSAKRLADIAYKNSERLTRLINDLLDLEKIETGRLPLRMQPIDLAELVEQAVEASRPLAQPLGVELVFGPTLQEARVQGDRDRLIQVVTNLISNAAKFSPKNDKVLISLERRQGKIRVSVTDHGPGIPEEFRTRIFQKFAQADNAGSGHWVGTGLGLNICKSIVERHGGVIAFETVPHLATTFYFEFDETPLPTAIRNGFSLIEAVVATFILAVVISIVFSLLRSSREAEHVGSVTADLETRSRLLVDAVKNELMFAKLNFLDVSPVGIRVRYQVPNTTGAVDFGYPDASGVFRSGWSAAIEFVPTRVLLETNAVALTPLPKEVASFSLNSDGDLVDLWFVGRVVKRVYSHNLVPALVPVYEITLCSDDLMLAFPSFNADIDGNGTPDSLFEFLNAQGLAQLAAPNITKIVRISVWIGRFDMDHRRFFLRRNEELIKLKNRQT
jgi:PAS domain S-box-containing protein